MSAEDATLLTAPSAPSPRPGYLYVYLSPTDRPALVALAQRRPVHRLSEAETRHLTPVPAIGSDRLCNDRTLIVRWLAANPTAHATPDRGAAYRPATPDRPATHLGWVSDHLDFVIYLRLHGRDRSDLSHRYCSPIRSFSDPDLVSFRAALGVPAQHPSEPPLWVPASEPL